MLNKLTVWEKIKETGRDYFELNCTTNQWRATDQYRTIPEDYPPIDITISYSGYSGGSGWFKFKIYDENESLIFDMGTLYGTFSKSITIDVKDYKRLHFWGQTQTGAGVNISVTWEYQDIR